jgi:hypothetical protein
MQSERGPGPAVYAGLFLTTLATLMHEILLTRIFSVTMFYHFAFVAISVAMFGMTVGAIVVYLRPAAYAAERVAHQLTKNALGYALSLVGTFFVYLQIPFIGDASPKSVLLLAASYVVIAVPFVPSGITVALALTRFPRHVAGLYAADLLGAAAGGIALVFTLDATDAATAVVVVAAAAALGACLFGYHDRAGPVWRPAAGATVFLIGLAAVLHAGLVRRGTPLVPIRSAHAPAGEEPSYVRWNAFSRVQVTGDPRALSTAAGWGLSRKSGAEKAVARQLLMAIDVSAGSVITHFADDTAPLWYLRDDVTNLAHYLRPRADVLVVGVGGGRDVLSALVFQQRSVTGVEVNENVLRATNGVYGDFSGHLDRDPRVSFVVDEARSFVARSTRRFDILQLSLTDTWAATAAGAFSLSENALYTVEAWRSFLEHLTPAGILTVSRWYFPARPAEMYRLASLARAALLGMGVRNPRDHVAMVRAPRASGLPGRLGNGVGTILVGREPLTPFDLQKLEREADRLGFEVVASPARSGSPMFDRILSGRNSDALYAAFPVDISAPTDDRPFFFQMLRLRDFAGSLGADGGDANRANLKAVRLLGILLLVVLVLTVLCIFVPLALGARTGGGDPGRTAPMLAFFLAIGLGFMFVEISQMQRLMVVLGRPTYALSVVLFALLVGTGIGSLLLGRCATRSGRSSAAPLAMLLPALLVFGVATPRLVAALMGASTTLRIGATAAALLPLGLLLGAPFPLGMRAASGFSPRLTPWLWGVNGTASVLASVLATATSLTWGISAAYWAGVVCYAAALCAYGVATRA